MAVLTEVRRPDVIGMLARRIKAVVAARTAAGHPGMVENNGYPGSPCVAVVTLLARGRMSRRPAGGGYAVVAAAAAAHHGGVIHVGDRAPCRRGMAVGTDLGRRNVIDRPR